MRSPWSTIFSLRIFLTEVDYAWIVGFIDCNFFEIGISDRHLAHLISNWWNVLNVLKSLIGGLWKQNAWFCRRISTGISLGVACPRNYVKIIRNVSLVYVRLFEWFIFLKDVVTCLGTSVSKQAGRIASVCMSELIKGWEWILSIVWW